MPVPYFMKGNQMARRYTLDTKIHALNLLDTHEGDLVVVSQELNIPAVILNTWCKKEEDIRRDYRQKLQRQFVRLKAELQVQMLERGMKIMACMDDDTLEKAPLNQLATALGSLVNHALKLDEASEDTDEQTEEKVIRIEYFYDGKVQDAPPWAESSAETSSSIQDSRLWQTLGKNGSREDSTNGKSTFATDKWLVARADLPDGESTLEGIEDEYQERDWYYD